MGDARWGRRVRRDEIAEVHRAPPAGLQPAYRSRVRRGRKSSVKGEYWRVTRGRRGGDRGRAPLHQPCRSSVGSRGVWPSRLVSARIKRLQPFPVSALGVCIYSR